MYNCISRERSKTAKSCFFQGQEDQLQAEKKKTTTKGKHLLKVTCSLLNQHLMIKNAELPNGVQIHHCALYRQKYVFLHHIINYCSIMFSCQSKSNPKNSKPWLWSFFLVRAAAHTGAVTLQEIRWWFIRTENNFFVNCLKKNKYIKCTYFIPLLIFKVVSLACLPHNNVSPDCLCQIYYRRVSVLQSRLMMNIWLEMRKQQCTDFWRGELIRQSAQGRDSVAWPARKGGWDCT